MRRQIPDDVYRFVLTSIPSVPYLEALLLLRANPATLWSAEALAQRLFLAATLCEALLGQLAEAGLAAPGEHERTFRWNAGTGLAGMVDKLAEIYAVNVVDVAALIHSRQERRAVEFADAFRLRRKQE